MVKNKIVDLVSNISPFDDIELKHMQETISWINSGDNIFRLLKPNVPEKHLVSYFCLFDPENFEILLVDHKNANLWLPTGGHVEFNEHPKDAVRRECLEELSIEAEFIIEEPFFITSTKSSSSEGEHTDVSLWYLLKGSNKDNYNFDRDEFYSIKWFKLDEIPFEKSDLHMGRFITKLKKLYNKN